MSNSLQINGTNISNLIRYEWMNRWNLYLGVGLYVFLFLIFLFLYIFYSNYQTTALLSKYIISDGKNIAWEAGNYQGIFISGVFILAIFATGQSFLDLREKKAARQYLLLPASHLEKYLVQFLGRFLLPLMIYPILFWLASVLSVGIFNLSILLLFENKAIDFPEAAPFFQLFSLPSEQPTIVYWILWGIFMLIPSLMFSGGVFYGKWNFILMPLSTVVIWGFMTLSALILSWFIYPVTVSHNGAQAGIKMFNFDKPEVFPEIPLAIVVITFFIWAAAIVSYVASYYRLTEKEA
jgi:hypothetical protein